MNWQEKIEAQIAELRNDLYPEEAATMQVLLDIAVAAEEQHREIFGDGIVFKDSIDAVGKALDKLREGE